AGTTLSRQIRLGRVGSSAAQNLVLLLQQAHTPLGFTQLTRLGRRGAGLDSGFDVGLADPLLQRHGVDTEVGGDLLESHTVFTVLSDADDVVAELLGIGPRAQQHPSRPAPQDKPDQMSPTHAPSPFERVHVRTLRAHVPSPSSWGIGASTRMVGPSLELLYVHDTSTLDDGLWER